jgi:4'-phosphopantetheinyl transferase
MTENHGHTAADAWSSRACRVLKTSDVEIVSVRLDAPAEVSAALWQLLSRDERQRADRFRYVVHRRRYIVARASLRQLLAERLHVAPCAVELVESSYGKPRLAPVHDSAGLEFNLSHSEALAVYAFTSGRVVGIDVELNRQIPDADDLAKCFFSSKETAALRAFPLDRHSQAFLACWTRKEAFVKALGLGLSCPLDAFDVTIDPDAPARITRIDERIGNVANWRLQAFTPYPSYIAAVAYRADGLAPSCAKVSASRTIQLCGTDRARSLFCDKGPRWHFATFRHLRQRDTLRSVENANKLNWWNRGCVFNARA